MLVFDLADDLFDDVFERDQAQRRSLRRRGRRPSAAAAGGTAASTSEIGRSGSTKIGGYMASSNTTMPRKLNRWNKSFVFTMPTMLSTSAFVDGHSRVGPVAHLFQNLLLGHVQVEGSHPFARHQAIADQLGRQAKHVADVLGLVARQDSGAARLFDDQRQLLDRVHHLVPLIGSKPSSRTTPLPIAFITVMNGRMTLENHNSGLATHRLTESGRCSATAFGASSPRITCRNVIKVKAMTVASRVRRDPGACLRKERKERLDQAGDRRLADPAQRQAGQGDAQLRGGDRVVQMFDRAQDRGSAGAAVVDHLVNAGAAHRHQGKLGRHEECVQPEPAAAPPASPAALLSNSELMSSIALYVVAWRAKPGRRQPANTCNMPRQKSGKSSGLRLETKCRSTTTARLPTAPRR